MADEDDVRRLALALPGTTERPCYGTPGYRVAGRLFARLHDQPGVLVLRCPDVSEKEALLASDPQAYFTTAHYDGHPHVLVRLAQVGVDELAELIADAWQSRAPRRLLAAWHGGTAHGASAHGGTVHGESGVGAAHGAEGRRR